MWSPLKRRAHWITTHDANGCAFTAGDEKRQAGLITFLVTLGVEYFFA